MRLFSTLPREILFEEIFMKHLWCDKKATRSFCKSSRAFQQITSTYILRYVCVCRKFKKGVAFETASHILWVIHLAFCYYPVEFYKSLDFDEMINSVIDVDMSKMNISLKMAHISPYDIIRIYGFSREIRIDDSVYIRNWDGSNEDHIKNVFNSLVTVRMKTPNVPQFGAFRDISVIGCIHHDYKFNGRYHSKILGRILLNTRNRMALLIICRGDKEFCEIHQVLLGKEMYVGYSCETYFPVKTYIKEKLKESNFVNLKRTNNGPKYCYCNPPVQQPKSICAANTR